MARSVPAGCWSGPGASSGSASGPRRSHRIWSDWRRHPEHARCAAAPSAGRLCRPPSAHHLGTNHADRPHIVQNAGFITAYSWWVDRGLPLPEQPASSPASRAEISGHHRHQRGHPVPSRRPSGFDRPIARARRPPAASGLSKTVNRTARQRADPAEGTGSCEPDLLTIWPPLVSASFRGCDWIALMKKCDTFDFGGLEVELLWGHRNLEKIQAHGLEPEEVETSFDADDWATAASELPYRFIGEGTSHSG